MDAKLAGVEWARVGTLFVTFFLYAREKEGRDLIAGMFFYLHLQPFSARFICISYLCSFISSDFFFLFQKFMFNITYMFRFNNFLVNYISNIYIYRGKLSINMDCNEL